MRPRTPAVVTRRLQDGDPLAEIRELLADAAEIAEDLADDSLQQLLQTAVDEIDEALEEAEDVEGGDDEEPELEANVDAPPGPRPRSGSYGSRAEFRVALRRWRRRKARYEGEAIARGRTPGVVTGDPDDGG